MIPRMTSYTDELRRMLAELEDTRRHLDGDIGDLRRIIERHDGPTVPGAASNGGSTLVSTVGASRAAKGETRSEILEVMRAHPPGPWRVGEVHALLPHRSKGSISTAMIRMVGAGLLDDAGYGLYSLPKGSPHQGESGTATPGTIFGGEGG